jgi:hypothetical protein
LCVPDWKSAPLAIAIREFVIGTDAHILEESSLKEAIAIAIVFISHRGADSGEAERIGAEIRARGHTVRLDVWEINVGSSIIGWMEEALGSARYVVLCLSGAGNLAPWMSREWMAALALQLQGHDIRLLPVRLLGGTLPVLLADIKYADLSNDWNRGVADLLKAIG